MRSAPRATSLRGERATHPVSSGVAPAPASAVSPSEVAPSVPLFLSPAKCKSGFSVGVRNPVRKLPVGTHRCFEPPLRSAAWCLADAPLSPFDPVLFVAGELDVARLPVVEPPPA